MLDIKDAKFLVERETNRIVGIKEIDGDEVYLPTFATDASGNVTGLVGPDGRELSVNGALDIRGFGARCNGVALYDATSTNAATSTINSATASFTSSDVGKVCVLVPYANVGGGTNYGTITAVNSPTQCVATLNVAPGTLTAATFIYGTDDGAAIDSALTAAGAEIHKGVVFIPVGITLSKRGHIVPTGVSLIGSCNYPTGGKAKDIRHYGSSLVLAHYIAGDFITCGDTASSPRGTMLKGFNVDGCGLCQRIIGNNTRTVRVQFVTAARARGEVIRSSATGRLLSCSFIGHNVAANVVQLEGDANMIDCIVTGAGNGYYSVKTSNGDDIMIANNHLWKDSEQSSLLGGQIFISFNSGATASGGITICNNKFDTSYGPHIYIKASGTSKGRGVNIIGNQGMQNNAVPDNTYPFMKLEVDGTSEIRSLNIHGNIGRASWEDAAQGTLTAFIDNSATTGAVIGCSVSGNIMDNCAAGYIGLTPTYSEGNLYIAGSGSTATAF